MDANLAMAMMSKSMDSRIELRAGGITEVFTDRAPKTKVVPPVSPIVAVRDGGAALAPKVAKIQKEIRGGIMATKSAKKEGCWEDFACTEHGNVCVLLGIKDVGYEGRVDGEWMCRQCEARSIFRIG